MVRELKARLAEIAAREQEIERRERAVHGPGPVDVLRSERESELDRKAEELADRAETLLRQQRELERGRLEMDQRRHELDRQRRELEVRRQQLEERWGELDHREQALLARQQEAERLQTEQRAVAERLAERERAFRLRAARQRHLLAGRRRELLRLKQSLAAGRREAEEELQRREQELEARRRFLEDDLSALRERTGRLDERERWLGEQTEALRQERRRVEQVEGELAAARRELDSRGAALGEQQAELDRRGAQMDRQQQEIEQTRRELDQMRAELETARRALLGREQEAAQAREQLAGQERSLLEARQALEERRQHQEELATELERRREELELERRKLEEAGRQVERRMDEALALHARLESREAELQQHLMHIQTEAQRLQHERRRLQDQQEELAAIRESAEADLVRVRRTLERDPGRLAGLSAPITARTVWLRALIAGAVAAVLVGAGWLAVERPAVRHCLELTIRQTRTPGPTAVYEHAARLARPEVLGGYLSGEQQQRWEEIRRSAELSIMPVPQDGVVLVSLRCGPELSAAAGELLRLAVQMYAARGGDLRRTISSGGGEARDLLVARLDGELQERRAALQQMQAALDQTAAAPSWETLLEGVAGLRAGLDESVERLRAVREKLANLRSQDSPRGSVAPDALREALTTDAVLAEDGRELRSAAREYQTELALAMLAVLDPLRELRASIGGLLKVIDEQRALQPPAEIGAVLETCSTAADELNRLLAEFAAGWEGSSEAVQRARTDEQIVALIPQQQASADAARGMVDRIARTLEELRGRAGNPGDGSGGGTRQIVVAAVLRGELNHVADALAAFEEGVNAIDLTHNFRLEAQDRRLRALLMRIRQREEAIAAALQQSADQAAAGEHEATVRNLAEEVGRLEQRRDELLAELAASIDRLQEAAQSLFARGTLEAGLRHQRSEVARLEAERQRAVSATTATIELPPDGLEVAVRPTEQVAGVHRWRNASLLGGAAGVLCLLSCLLALVRAPLTRPDAEEPSAVPELPPPEAVSPEWR
jgi:chromosome segregation ATPase